VIGPTGAVRVMIATKPVDFRKGAEGLAALVRETMAADPFSGAVYVFRAKRADRIKLVFWDGTGLCLFAKRLEDGIFRWPKIEDGVMRLAARPRSTRDGDADAAGLIIYLRRSESAASRSSQNAAKYDLIW
jgi:transposase